MHIVVEIVWVDLGAICWHSKQLMTFKLLQMSNLALVIPIYKTKSSIYQFLYSFNQCNTEMTFYSLMSKLQNDERKPKYSRTWSII